MAKYIKITSTTTTTLLSSSDKQYTGNIKSINISNNHVSTDASISLYLDDNTTDDDYYYFKTVILPKGTSLFLDDGLSFDISSYALKFTNTGSDDLSIIIK
tara:strand:+ start:1902 stop:2204 length:303 start_codon:yes stop_codon:yes gene_type:complete